MKNSSKSSGILRFICIVSLCLVALCFVPVGSVSCLPGTLQVQAKTKAADYTMYINSGGTSKQARTIHSYLSAGKSVDLKVKATSKKAATKIVNNLAGLVAGKNKRGVRFHYSYLEKSRTRYVYRISKTDSKLYNATLKLTDKMITKVRRIIAESSVGVVIDAMEKYPEEQEAMQRLIYHCAVYRVEHYYEGEIYTGSNDTLTSDYIDIFTYAKACELVRIKSASFGTGELRSYEEFLEANPDVVEDILALDHPYGVSLSTVMEAYTIFAPLMTGNFCDYSDARKLLLIDTADLFGCNIAHGDYWDVFGNNHYSRNLDEIDQMGCYYYTGGNDFTANYKAINHLINNTAYGDCGAFADFEELLFEQYGMNVCQNSVSGFMHIWTVVKAKNADGKTLWIPFDYGIGPRWDVGGGRPDCETEDDLYKLYLTGLKGNPGKMNFVNTDLK